MEFLSQMLESLPPKKILVLAAHPDDETLGCGATLARLSSEGAYIKLMTFTDGESSRKGSTSNRNSKLKGVCEEIGISDYVHANFPDNKLDTVPLLELCKYIEDNIDFKPDIIFTHHESCLNVDHRSVYRATITVFRPQRS